MSGKIKAGLGTLIGNAGEHYVVAELLKRGIIAALTPRNAPNFDILATNHGKTVRIRVKTKTEHYDIWQWAVKKDIAIFHELADQDDFTVLVNLTEDHQKMNFYVIPTKLINEWLVRDFEKWLATPGKGGRQHSPSNVKRSLSYKQYKADLEQYHNNWDVLWQLDS